MKYLVWDLGLYVDHANSLWKSKDDKVWYFTPWQSAFPKYIDYAIGKNFEHLEKVLYFWDYVEKADCIVFFDVHGNDICNYLRKIYPKKSIYGSGLGERLENNRWALKKLISKLSLPLQKAVHLKGVTELRKYLQTHPDVYVKVNIFRSDRESFYAKDYKTIELIIDEIESSFGMHKEEYEFVVEDSIHTDVEVGCDMFFWGKDYVKPYIYGYEWHKGLYIGRVSNELPIPLKETMDKFKEVFTELSYRGAVSTEEKIKSKLDHYFLDLTARLPAPLSALYPQFIKNWAEMVYKIGLGQEVKMDLPFKYVGAFPFGTEHAKDHWVKLEVEPKHRDKIKFRSVTQNAKGYFAVKGMESVAVVVAAGNSVDEVINKLMENSKYVEAHGMDKDGIKGIDTIKEIIAKGEKVGIPF